MITNSKPICIIPARGGSKRIPNKNIKEFHGIPIIMYTISKAIESGIFDKIFVASDSDDILEMADRFSIGKIKLPLDVCDDHSPTWKALDYSINYIECIYNINYEYLCCMYATAPFIRVSDLKNGYIKIMDNKVGSVFTITTFPFPIQRALFYNGCGNLEMIDKHYELVRSQDLMEFYHDAGQFYWLDISRFKVDHKMYSNDAMGIELPRVLVQDIDTLDDWEVASVKYSVLKEMGYEI